jgi:peptide/nickel transport system permease protein
VLKFILRRLLILPVIIFLVTLLLFLLLMQLPVEQRAEVYMPSARPNLSEEEYQRLVEVTIERYGLDQPVPVQYANWMRNLVAGEWGYSPSWRQSVLDGLRGRAPATIELTLYAMIPAIGLAILFGSQAARHDSRLPDHLIRAATFVAWAFPSFILALILMNVFYAWLGWFPPERVSIWASFIIHSDSFRTYTGLLTIDTLLNGNIELFWDSLRHLVLPAFTLAIAEWALLTRIMRSSLREVLKQDYITTARAKGVREEAIIAHHARRNALLPVISSGGAMISMLISGIVVVEVIFNLNGIGRWAVSAILQADIPVAIGFALFSCLVTVFGSLLADTLYALVDPRIRLF